MSLVLSFLLRDVCTYQPTTIVSCRTVGSAAVSIQDDSTAGCTISSGSGQSLGISKKARVLVSWNFIMSNKTLYSHNILELSVLTFLGLFPHKMEIH